MQQVGERRPRPVSKIPKPTARHPPFVVAGRNWRRMFDRGINCDVTIHVDGEEIGAHMCILRARCHYFARALSGNREMTWDDVYLDGFSADCVYFTLYQIYSGATMMVPWYIDMFELADLADLLCYEGLKDLVAFILENQYFHQFHRPCPGCLMLVSKFLPWSGAEGYSEIYSKILQWIKKYGDEIWTSKEFASLPPEVIQKCFEHHSFHIDSETALDMITWCDKLMYALPKVTWTVNIFRHALKLLRDCIQYIRTNLVDVLSSESFMTIDARNGEYIPRLEDRLMVAIERATPEQTCGAYAQLNRLLPGDFDNVSVGWRDLIVRLTKFCENALICCAAQAMSASTWQALQPELQKKIQRSSGVVIESTFTPAMERVNNFSRSRNIDILRAILHAELGKINRVPPDVSRQILSAPPVSKQYTAVPGNSMVTSTKKSNGNNLKNPQANQINASAVKNNYKNIKSRYMNPKPTHSVPDVVTSTTKAVPSANGSSQRGRCPPKPNKNSDGANKGKPMFSKKFPDVTVTKPADPSKRGNFDRSSTDFIVTKNSALVQSAKKKASNSTSSLQVRSGPPFREKPSAVAYISPYSVKSLSRVDTESSNSAKNSLTDPKCSGVNEMRYDLAFQARNRSPLSKWSDPSSSVHSSPGAARPARKMVAAVAPTKNSRAFSPNLTKQTSFTRSTLVFCSKTSKATDNKSRPINALMKAHKSAPEVNLGNGLSLAAAAAASSSSTSDPRPSNDGGTRCSLERSRTFVKSEPSIISKDITMDSSIEMYPE